MFAFAAKLFLKTSEGIIDVDRKLFCGSCLKWFRDEKLMVKHIIWDHLQVDFEGCKPFASPSNLDKALDDEMCLQFWKEEVLFDLLLRKGSEFGHKEVLRMSRDEIFALLTQETQAELKRNSTYITINEAKEAAIKQLFPPTEIQCKCLKLILYVEKLRKVEKFSHSS